MLRKSHYCSLTRLFVPQVDAHGKVHPDETKQNHVASWACQVGRGEVILSQTQRALRTSLHPRAEETELASQDCGTAGVFCLSKVIKDPYAPSKGVLPLSG